jgi:tellurite resistance protein
MGLFDNIFGGHAPNRSIGKADAFTGILLAASACDGHCADEEVQAVFTITARMKLFEGFNQNRWNTMIDGLLKILKKEGPDRLMERCAEALPDELRETAFANACDIILADGVVEEEEKEYMDRLQKALDIDGDTALTIVEVMIIKNKG